MLCVYEISDREVNRMSEAKGIEVAETEEVVAAAWIAT